MASFIKKCSEYQQKKGSGFLNHAINASNRVAYQFCRSGTHLEKRLTKGDRGINPLDAVWSRHSLFAEQRSQNDDSKKRSKKRHIADKSLRRRGNELSWKIRLLERELLPQLFGQLWKPKRKLSLKTKKKKKNLMKKRILSIIKRGIIPIIPLLGIDRRRGRSTKSYKW